MRSGHSSQLPTISEVGQLKGTNTQLRRELDACRKELSGQKAQLEATQNQLRQADLARAACDEYARRLEQKLERSGKGVALLKASRLQSDLEFLEKENQIVFSDLQSKDKELQNLQDELKRQHGLVDQASRQIGLPSRQTLEELYDLRQQVSQMTESLGDKDDQLKRQAVDLQDFNVYRSDYKRVKERCDEAELLLKRAEEDKATLLDYIEDLRRKRDQDQAKIEELVASRDECRRQVAGLDVKRAELEQLLKEQLQMLQASKQQCDVHEAQAEKHRRACSELNNERTELREQLLGLQRQHSLLEVELDGMQESMRGVLDLSRAQQVELNSRVDGLTHRVTAALSAASKAPGPQPPPAGSGQPQSQSLILSMSRVSRQQEALIEQHLQLKQSLRGMPDTQDLNEQLKSKVSSLEAEQRRLLEERCNLEARCNELTFAWSLLESALRPGSTGTPHALPGKETELVKFVQSELAQARSGSEVLQHKCQEQAREREQLLRTIASLKESIEVTREAMAALPPAEDFSEALARNTQLEALTQQLQQQLRSQDNQLRNQERAATEAEHSHARAVQLLNEKVESLQGSLDAANQEQQQLHELVHKSRLLQVEAVHEATSAKQVIQQLEQDILQLKVKLQLASRPLPTRLEHESAAQEIRLLNDSIVELRGLLSSAREENQQLQEQSDKARAVHAASMREVREEQQRLQEQLERAGLLHADALREAREEQQQLDGQVAKAKRAHAEALREAREKLEAQAEKSNVLNAAAVQEAKEQLEKSRDLHAAAMFKAREQFEEQIDKLSALRAEDVREMREQLEKANVLHAEEMRDARQQLEKARVLHAEDIHEAREEQQQQLREVLEKGSVIQAEAAREAAAAKQVIQQLEQEIRQLRTKLALRPFKQPHPSTSRRVALSDDRSAAGLDQLAKHLEHTPYQPSGVPAHGAGWEPDAEPGRRSASTVWPGTHTSEFVRALDKASDSVLRKSARAAHGNSAVHFRDLAPATPSSSEDGGDDLDSKARVPARQPSRQQQRTPAQSSPPAAAPARSNLFHVAAPSASKATTAKFVQAQLAALSASYKGLRSKGS